MMNLLKTRVVVLRGLATIDGSRCIMLEIGLLHFLDLNWCAASLCCLNHGQDGQMNHSPFSLESDIWVSNVVINANLPYLST
jgi:hypothetical protein